MKMLLMLILLGSVFSCKGPEDVLRDENGVVTRLPHIWKSSTSSDGGLVSSMFAQHIYDNRFILTAHRLPQSEQNRIADNLSFKRLDDGKSAWVWGDRFSATEGAITFDYGIYSFEDVLFYNYGAIKGYGINQKTGQTIWRKQWKSYNSILTFTGLGTHFYFTGTPPDTYTEKRWEESIYQGDMNTGEVRELAKLKTFSDSVWHDPSGFDYVSRGRSLKPFVRGTNTFILVSYDLPDIRPYYQNTPVSGYISLYNLTQKKWEYERMPMLSDVKLGIESEAGGGNYPNIIGDKVYFAVNMWVGCYDLMTGKRLWFQRLTPASLFSDMIVAEGKLLANGMNAKLYALDPETGRTLWTQESSGIGSAMHYQEGVVYYIASQKLLATRVSDGKLLWKLDCPDAYTENRPESWFMGFVTGLPGKNGQKGRIFASTHLNVYCFEAAQ